MKGFTTIREGGWGKSKLKLNSVWAQPGKNQFLTIFSPFLTKFFLFLGGGGWQKIKKLVLIINSWHNLKSALICLRFLQFEVEKLEYHYEMTLCGKSTPIWLRFLQEGKSEHHYDCQNLYVNNKEDFYCLLFSWSSVLAPMPKTL